MEKYVLGFALSEHAGGHVALIIKKHPTWQAGLINGIGGKIEIGESGEEAMIREFYEETGLLHTRWDFVATMASPLFHCKVFKTYVSFSTLQLLKTRTDEEVVIKSIHDIFINRCDYLPNIPHLIGLCLDPDLSGVQRIWYKHGNENGPQLQSP